MTGHAASGNDPGNLAVPCQLRRDHVMGRGRKAEANNEKAGQD
jgi:hypothetical protein